jgi:signal-transduction protein with cAMP-binding, CBS, and nucleotidyltransferase domain
MSKNVLTVDKSTSLQEAALNMRKSNVGCVIVTEDTKPIGIVTERDFVTKVAADGRPLFTDIYEVISSPLITKAAQMMKEKGIHKLAVKKNEKIIGIVTATDIVRISSLGSDSQMHQICDQILLRMKNETLSPK